MGALEAALYLTLAELRGYCDRFPSILRAFCSHCQGTMKRIPELKGKQVRRASKTRKSPLYDNLRDIDGNLWVDCKVCAVPTRFSLTEESTVILDWVGRDELERADTYSHATGRVEEGYQFKRKRIPVTVTGRVCAGCRETHAHSIRGSRKKIRDTRAGGQLEEVSTVSGKRGRGYNDA